VEGKRAVKEAAKATVMIWLLKRVVPVLIVVGVFVALWLNS
jgi:hypothetical protein